MSTLKVTLPQVVFFNLFRYITPHYRSVIHHRSFKIQLVVTTNTSYGNVVTTDCNWQ